MQMSVKKRLNHITGHALVGNVTKALCYYNRCDGRYRSDWCYWTTTGTRRQNNNNDDNTESV